MTCLENIGSDNKQKFFMNKIKIINADLLQLMQSTAKEFRVTQVTCRSTSNIKRPKTPQQMFKCAIKMTVTSELRKRRKLKTMNNSSMLQEKGSESATNLGVIEKKMMVCQSEQRRPTTSVTKKKILKQDQEIGEIKQEIHEVLKQLKHEEELSQLRKKIRYEQYENKKFGKFWNIYKVKLNTKKYSNPL